MNELMNVGACLIGTTVIGIGLTAYINYADVMIDRAVDWIDAWLTRREYPLHVSWKSALDQMDAEFVANRNDEMVE